MKTLFCGLLFIGILGAQHPSPSVDGKVIESHVRFLSSDLLEGRGTGERGGALTVSYLETQCRLLGLEPLNGKSYVQAVRIAGLKTKNSSQLSFMGKTAWAPQFGSEIVYGTNVVNPKAVIDAPVIFVGYGITSPEEKWDDFKGIDVKGKIIVVMVNDPKPLATDPNRFGGKALTYFGRWTYKFEEARKRGAAGILLIHTDESATYPWSVVENGWNKERAQVIFGTPLQGWMTNATASSLFKMAGLDLNKERLKAERKDFQPVPLKLSLQGSIESEVREFDQYNVGGIVSGTDPLLSNEAIVYSAHWDHLGKNQALVDSGKDGIYNGAVDNATGTASLLAMASVAKRFPSRRSQIFLWVCAEEQGLIGSAYYAQHPLWPLDKTVANLNLDSTNYLGPTSDIGSRGSEKSSLGATAEQAAKEMGLTITPAEPDLNGSYFRSDHFNFAKAGVPAFSVEKGKIYLGGQAEEKKKLAEAYGANDYHQVTDEITPAWDFEGTAQQAEYTLRLGWLIGQASTVPRRKQ